MSLTYSGRMIHSIDQILVEVPFYMVIQNKPVIYQLINIKEQAGYIKIKTPKDFLFIDASINKQATYKDEHLEIVDITQETVE